MIMADAEHGTVVAGGIAHIDVCSFITERVMRMDLYDATHGIATI